MATPEFAALILTHGRPDNVKTLRSLRRGGYTGRIVMVLDDEDPTADAYRANYGDEPGVEFAVFDKRAAFAAVDRMQTDDASGSPLYARHASFDVAERLGIDVFCQLDDDYLSFDYRVTSDGAYKTGKATQLDGAFEAMVEFMYSTDVECAAFPQVGDFVAGGASQFMRTGKRKAMNSQFCRVDRRFTFHGHFNDDVNTYMLHGLRGRVHLTFGPLTVVQTMTQQSPGGITEDYIEAGTYVKSFSTVIARPDCVRVGVMGMSNPRIHHTTQWDYAVPKIVSEATRKA